MSTIFFRLALKPLYNRCVCRSSTHSFQSDEPRFLATYPEAEEGHSRLLEAIRAAERERGEGRSCKPSPAVPPAASTAAHIATSVNH